MTSDSNANCITMKTIEQEIADEYLDNLILNIINTIRKNRKRPDTSSIQEYLHKNCDVTVEIVETRLRFVTKKNRIENKLTKRKSSCFIKDQTFINGPIQPNIFDQSSPVKHIQLLKSWKNRYLKMQTCY